MQRVLITGAGGNLGTKLALHVLSWPESEGWRLVLLDALPICHEQLLQLEAQGKLHVVLADLRTRGEWAETFRAGDIVIHLAAQNPYPEASWEDSSKSMDITTNVVAAAREGGARRLLFASSNHVMGGYREEGPKHDAGMILPSSTMRPGTKFRIPSVTTDATPYAVAKWGGEKLCHSSATEGFEIIAIRIGWCQPGDNLPATLSATGTPTIALGEPFGEVSTVDGYDNELQIEQWFRLMWLSNGDLLHLVDRCVHAPWPEGHAPFMVVNAMSSNTGMRWDIANGIGYMPNDDVTEHFQV